MTRSAVKAGPEYMKAIQAASVSYAKRDFPAALKALDEADKIKPDLPESLNLRGAIYAEQHDFDRARDTFEKALKAQPTAFLPKFNLAEILLMQKKPAEARAAFQDFRVTGANRELVQFKIVLTYLMEHNDAGAQAALREMKFPGDTAAYYFANAAWEFSQGHADKGKDWVKNGIGIFGYDRCYPLYDSLADFGWVEKRTPPPVEPR